MYLSPSHQERTEIAKETMWGETENEEMCFSREDVSSEASKGSVFVMTVSADYNLITCQMPLTSVATFDGVCACTCVLCQFR